MSRVMKRREERELAFRGIFQFDFYDGEGEIEYSIDHFLIHAGEGEPEDVVPGETGGYARNIIESARTNLTEIDDIIKGYLKDNWDFSRIPKAEKALLRLAVTELFFEKVPKEIAINETLELSKKYGEDNSKRYINGILNNIATDYEDRIITD